MDPRLAAAMAAAGMLAGAHVYVAIAAPRLLSSLTLSCRSPRPKKFGAAALAGAAASRQEGEELSAIEAAQLAEEEEAAEEAFVQYSPRHTRDGQPHPDPVVESASLAG
jgi:hypothetical protein